MKKTFSLLNEAMTEELTKRFILSPAIQANPLFKQEVEETNRIRRATVNKSGQPLFNEEFFYAKIGQEKGKEYVFAKRFTREQERRILNDLIDKIFEKNKAQFSNREVVFNLFTNAFFNGQTMPLIRLIEKTFGRGTFNKIKRANDKISELEALIKSF